MKIGRVVMGACAVLCLAAPVGAAVPTTMTYTGYLEQGGAPFTGNITAVFDLHRDATGGSAVWTETHPTIAVASGRFTVELGRITTLDPALFNGTSLFLGVTLNGTTLLPRTPFSSVPFARRAETADSIPWSQVSDVAVGPGLQVVSGSNVMSVDDAHIRNLCIDTPAEVVGAISNQSITPADVTTGNVNASSVRVSNAPSAPNDATPKSYVDSLGCTWSGAESALSACDVDCSGKCGTYDGQQIRTRTLVCGGAAQRLVTEVRICSVNCNSSCGN